MYRAPAARFILLVLALVSAPPAEAQKAADTLRVPFEVFRLPNGLTAILSVDRATPTVAVNVWYHVGSKNEAPGRTGFAHLFEHIMFTGSGHVPYGLHDKLTEGVGGMNNGTTNNDRTNYYQTVPSNYLETVLWLESDRMGFLLEALDRDKLNAQREVVKNERRQGVDNQPYGRAFEILARATYPSAHPYSWSVIGSMEDLSAASEEDVRSFFRLYYAPNNAYIAIVGDFEPAQAKGWLTKYFGGIPAGPPVPRPDAPPVRLDAERRLVFEDRVEVPRLYLQWPTIGVRHADRFALDVLASILTGARTARLTRSLVYEQQSAASVNAFQSTSEAAGDFVIIVTPRPEGSLTDLERSIDRILERLRAEGPTPEEIQKAVAGAELAFVRSLESNLGKAFRLADGAAYHGDPGAFRRDYEQVRAVTAADVMRVARTYLTAGRVVLSVVPAGRLQDAARPGASTRVTDYDAQDRGEEKR